MRHPTSTWTAQLVAELQRSIAAANLQIESDSLDAEVDTLGPENRTLSATETEIWLSGGGARVPNLAGVVEAELNIPTVLWNPLQAIEQYMNVKIEPERAEGQNCPRRIR